MTTDGGGREVRLSRLVRAIRTEGGAVQEDSSAVSVSGISYDSRRVRRGDLFVALPGRNADGAAFAGEALRRGAAAVLHAGRLALPKGAGGIRCGDPRRAMGDVAAAFWDDPTAHLRVVGVTGTNGKSTSAFMIRDLLEAAGIGTALLGTIVYAFAGREVPADRTMPETPDTQRLFAEALRAGCAAGVMEVSSQGIAAERHRGLLFAAALFTNLTRDHLDFHGDMEHYFAAKRRLFAEGLAPDAPLAVGTDDPWGRRLAEEFRRDKLFTFAIDREAAVRARGIEMDECGSRFTVDLPGARGLAARIPFPGRHNILNALGALAVGAGLGLDAEGMVAALAHLRPVPGRLERVPDEAGGRHVFVDYAHTDDALRHVLETLRAVAKRRVLCVVGCGGDRDRKKRPLMAGVATELADWTVLTSDNPRSERPEDILAEMTPGIVPGKPCTIVPDRREAIAAALAEAREGDIVLVAGKGHETYQEIRGIRHPFDDRAVARDLLAASC